MMVSAAVLVGVLLLVGLALAYGLLRREEEQEPPPDDWSEAQARDTPANPETPALRPKQAPTGPASQGVPPHLTWVMTAAGSPEVAALREVCLRRAHLLEEGVEDDAIFGTLRRELTVCLLSDNPPTAQAGERLDLQISEYEVASSAVKSASGGHPAALASSMQQLGRLLDRWGVSIDSPSPLREYRYLVRCSEALSVRSLPALRQCSCQYLSAEKPTTEDVLPQRYAALRDFARRCAQRMQNQLDGYEEVQVPAHRVGRIQTLSTYLKEIQESSRGDRHLSGLEAELKAYFLSDSRSLLLTEYRELRGRRQWKAELPPVIQVALAGRELTPVVLTLYDEKRIRPKRVRVTSPGCNVEGAVPYRVGPIAIEQNPGKDGTIAVQLALDVPVPPATSFSISLELPLRIDWDDAGIWDWDELVFTSDLACVVRRPRINPYTDGFGGLPLRGDSPLFTGRQDIVEDILEHLRERTASFFVLWGLSRSGKTSVINRIAHLIRDEAVVVSTSGTLEGMLPGGYVRALKDCVQQELQRQGIHLSRKVQEKRRETRREPLEDFFFLLNDIEGILAEKHRMLLVMLDEYDKLALDQERGAKDSTLWLIKTLFDRPAYSSFVRFIATGTFSLSQLEREHRPWREVLGGRMTHRRLDLFGPAEAAELVTMPSASASVKWGQDAINQAYALTGGHPYLVNLLCYSVVEESYGADGGLVVSESTITRAVDGWLQESGGGIDALKFCYHEPSSWTRAGTKIVLHVLSKLSEDAGASCLRDLPCWTQGDVSDYLRRHYPTLSLPDLGLDAAFDDLEKRQVVRTIDGDGGRAYGIRFGILDYALRRSGALFERVIKEEGCSV